MVMNVPWEPRESLPDDFDVWIGTAIFGYRSNYTDQSGKQLPLLIWTDLYTPELEPGEQNEIIWSLGTGWDVAPDGSYVTPGANKRNEKGFTNTSMMGRLIARVAKDMKVPFPPNASPNVAATWVGLGFHMNRQDIHFEGGGNIEIKDRKRLMPTSYLGRKEQGEVRRLGSIGGVATPPGTPAQNGTPSTLTASAASAGVPIAVGVTTNPLLDTVRAKAKEAKAAGQQKAIWQAAVIPLSSQDPAILSQILDDGPSGIWATS